MVDGMSTESIRSDAQDTSDRLILITLGRYSGRHHASLLQYRRYGTDLLVIATNDRQRAKPDWYLDIKEEPIVQIELGGATFYARAITPTGR